LLTPTSTDFIGGGSSGHVAVPTHCGTKPQRASLRALTRHVRSRDRAAASPVVLRDAFNSRDEGSSSSSSSSSSSAPEPRRSQRLQKVATGDELSRVRALYAISGNSLRFKVLSNALSFVFASGLTHPSALAFIPIQVNGVPVPSYLLTTKRDPAFRGCFILESCWCVLLSFTMPPRVRVWCVAVPCMRPLRNIE
jgi:hypothetical protein